MEDYVYRDLARLQTRHWWFRARQEILSRILEGLKLPPQAEILEIGCGCGGNLAMLGRFGRVSAMENDDGARKFAAAVSGIEVQQGSLPAAIPFRRSFDLVCLFDVLEHVADDMNGVKALAGLIKPDGRIMITVPAFMFLYGPHDRNLHHFRRYDRKRLVSVLNRAGLIVEKMTFFNTLLFPALVATRIFNRLQSLTPNQCSAGPHLNGNPLGYDIPGKTVNRLLYRIFRSEGNLLPSIDLPFGGSLMAVAGLHASSPVAAGDDHQGNRI